SFDYWLACLGGRSVEVPRLLGARPEEQDRRGYRHTLREISQQPLTWIETAAGMDAHLPLLRDALHHLQGNAHPGTMLLTGSGSSVYAGECLAPALQAALGLTVRPVPGGEIL